MQNDKILLLISEVFFLFPQCTDAGENVTFFCPCCVNAAIALICPIFICAVIILRAHSLGEFAVTPRMFPGAGFTPASAALGVICTRHPTAGRLESWLGNYWAAGSSVAGSALDRSNLNQLFREAPKTII